MTGSKYPSIVDKGARGDRRLRGNTTGGKTEGGVYPERRERRRAQMTASTEQEGFTPTMRRTKGR